MGHRIRTWLKRAVMGAVLAAVVVWTGDWLLLRLKVARDRGAYGSVEVHYRYALHLKNKRIEQYTAKPRMQECVHSAFPHLNESPCWYVERHANDVQELDSAPWHFYYQ
jgi:hypothetical protein